MSTGPRGKPNNAPSKSRQLLPRWPGSYVGARPTHTEVAHATWAEGSSNWQASRDKGVRKRNGQRDTAARAQQTARRRRPVVAFITTL